MERKVNTTCVACDYAPGCHKKLKLYGQEYLAKEQDMVKMTCRNVVHTICRDCQLFQQKRCAAWKIQNGKMRNTGELKVCPKKIQGEFV